ncbi:SMR family transporter [Kineococcus endophyticus]|uniref:SMR family transporter n=1 Tax=Kineococcus endophyticus TaxID=1181883 RepID=A0ABV3P827_9ACTN
MAWVFLAVAIIAEVAATLSLKMAVTGRKAWYAAVAAGYLVAIGLLSLALDAGLGLGLTYGAWAAAGVLLTTLAGAVLFAERVSRTSAVGIALVITGIALVKWGTS